MKSESVTNSELDSVNLLTPEEIADFRITQPIFDRYRERFKDLTSYALIESIKADFMADDPDGLPPMESFDIMDRYAHSEDGDVEHCEDCGELDYECTCESECDQQEGGRLREFFDIVKARHDLDRQAEENGEFTASILSDSDSTFQAIAQEASRTVGVPETITTVSVLAAVSAAIGKGLYIKSRPERETPLGFYFIGFARSGTGKTESTKVTLSPIYRKQRELREAWDQDLADIDANLELAQASLSFLIGKAKKGKQLDAQESSNVVKLKKQIKDLETQKSSPPSVYVEDTTLAGMRDALNLNNGQMSFISDDAGKALQNLLGEHSNLKMPEDNLLLKGYSVGDVSVERAGRTIFIPQIWASLFWLAQPDKLQLLTGSQWLQEGGFMCRCPVARFNCVPHVMPDQGVPEELLEKYYQKWNLIYKAYRKGYVESGERKTIKVSGEVMAIMKEWEQHIVDLRLGKFADFDGFAARWIENGWRIAGILHVAKHLDKSHEVPLDQDSAETAIKMMEFFIKEQLALMSASRESARSNQIDKIAKFIERKGGVTTLGQFKNDGHNPDDVLACIKANPDLFEAVEVPPSKGVKSFIKIRKKHKATDEPEKTGANKLDAAIAESRKKRNLN